MNSATNMYAVPESGGLMDVKVDILTLPTEDPQRVEGAELPPPTTSLRSAILAGLQRPAGEKSIPTTVLYDDAGLKLFDQITYTSDYYLTEAEVDILRRHAASFVKFIVPGTCILELGCG